jgi:2-aminoethylphosphonate-pyruvate transaminase
MGFCIARESALEKTEGNSPSLVLDLYDQWRAMQKNRQWRFTPPTHVLLAFDQALTEYQQEGGVAGRGGRYRENCDLLVATCRPTRPSISPPFTTGSRTRDTSFIRAS